MTVDVAARLAAGRPSVSNTQAYVSACHAVGYQHPDLTAHGAQITEWYCGEEGLDLHMLDADCALLRAAAVAADEAAHVACDGQAALSSAWQGESGTVATDFVERHCASALAVAEALHAAAEACEVLRDTLGRLVDEKVDAAVAVDDRRVGERSAWLAAAATVTGGGAARDQAVEIVTHQITPYVDADVRTEWLTAMRSTTASVAAAYYDALVRVNGAPPAYFAVPGQWGTPPVASSVAASPAVATVPAAAAPIVSAPELPPVGDPTPVTAPPASPSDTTAAQPLPSTPLPEASGGLGAAAPAGMPALPDAAGGLSGIAGQIADALGGLFDGLPDSGGSDLPELDDPAEADDAEDKTEDEDEDVEPTVEEDVPEEVPVEQDTAVDDEQPTDEPAVTETAPPVPEPEPAPLAAESPEPPEVPDEQTPCEIAADELAQVGQ
ncbi:hypothetical protein ACTXG7_06415 [Mycolicibacterium sp. Dal123E01]|uniref:hypothetical protein n=1 Tax=Mycolicibacterium sp. Dal123E01 TaxID=3457578 RepID=UPI00403E47C7